MNEQMIVYTVMAVVLIALAIIVLAVPRRSKPPRDSQWLSFGGGTSDDEIVDPWTLQLALMQASEQRVPMTPLLTADTLLYYALILEEVHELGEALAKVLDGAVKIRTNTRMAGMLSSVSDDMSDAAYSLRALIPTLSGDIEMTREQRREILDGTTDITVVNCGFSLAAGMRGDLAYQRITRSNLSKANPATGKIDKDPSGKWIKGEKYKMPYLEDLID